MPNSLMQPQRTRLYRYAIASSDMYYTELAQRDVYVEDDPVKGFRIWGEVGSLGPDSAIDLCQMFLEQALYYRSWCRMDEARYHMRDFGERLGLALARFLQQHPPADVINNPGACALLYVWESMKVQITVEQVGPELRFIFAECPLYDTAERTGLREVELALEAVNSLCQSLIHTIDPHLSVCMPLQVGEHTVFSVTAAV